MWFLLTDPVKLLAYKILDETKPDLVHEALAPTKDAANAAAPPPAAKPATTSVDPAPAPSKAAA
jgi:hypothetical protein